MNAYRVQLSFRLYLIMTNTWNQFVRLNTSDDICRSAYPHQPVPGTYAQYNLRTNGQHPSGMDQHRVVQSLTPTPSTSSHMGGSAQVLHQSNTATTITDGDTMSSTAVGGDRVYKSSPVVNPVLYSLKIVLIVVDTWHRWS
jgi:hypothetical protein